MNKETAPTWLKELMGWQMDAYDKMEQGISPALGTTAFLQAKDIAAHPDIDWPTRYRQAADAIEAYLKGRK